MSDIYKSLEIINQLSDDKPEIGIILGSEKDGIAQNLIDLSNEKVKIPMLGKIDSLNVISFYYYSSS